MKTADQLLKNGKLRAMTLTEMIVAMAIMVIVMAAVVPQIYSIQKSWAYKQSSTEVLQNGRVLMDHITANLSQATQITSVSAASSNEGFIQYLDNDGNAMRYDINGRNYVEFGQPSSLSQLAGPISELNFICRDINNMAVSTTDSNCIRTVTISATLNAPDNSGLSKTFTSTALLRTNALADRGSTSAIYTFDAARCKTPAMCAINTTNSLCVYEGDGSHGYAAVLSADVTTLSMNILNSYMFDSATGKTPALIKMDGTHYLCAYAGSGDNGTAVILTVNPSTWVISSGPSFVFDGQKGMEPALAQISSSDYLCVYRGDGDKGYAVILTADTFTHAVSKGTTFLFDSFRCMHPDLVNIWSDYYLCAYRGKDDDGYADILAVNTISHTVANVTSPFEFDAERCDYPALTQIDLFNYLCTYTGKDDDGFAVLLKTNLAPFWIITAASYEFDPKMGKLPSLMRVDNQRCLSAYQADHSFGKAAVLDFDSFPADISTEANIIFDQKHCISSALAPLRDNWFLCVYQGDGDKGYAVMLNAGMQIRP